MTFRWKRRRLWIVHFSWLEMFLYSLIAVAWVLVTSWWWFGLIGVLAFIAATHPVAIELGPPPTIQRFYAMFPRTKKRIASLELHAETHDASGERDETLTIGGETISCDRPRDVAQWIRAHATDDRGGR